MPHLSVHLTKARQTITLDRSAYGFHGLVLYQFKGFGLATGQPTLYLKIWNQSVQHPYGNIGSRFQLMFREDGTSYLCTPMVLSGAHIFNDNLSLEFIIENVDGSDAQFDSLDLNFYGHDKIFKIDHQFNEIDLISMQG